MADIIEKAARALAVSDGYSEDELDMMAGDARVDPMPEYRQNTRAVIRSLRDNTDSPRVCEELTRMLGEEER